jgi:hypothetical protein
LIDLDNNLAQQAKMTRQVLMTLLGMAMSWRRAKAYATTQNSAGAFLRKMMNKQNEHLETSGHVYALDIFCGRGVMTRSILTSAQQACPTHTFEIVGIDDNPKNIEYAKNVHTGITFRCGDVTSPYSPLLTGIRLDAFDWFLFQHTADRIDPAHVGFLIDRMTARTRYFPNPRGVCIIFRYAPVASSTVTESWIRRQFQMYCTNSYDIVSDALETQEHMTAVIVHPDLSVSDGPTTSYAPTDGPWTGGLCFASCMTSERFSRRGVPHKTTFLRKKNVAFRDVVC